MERYNKDKLPVFDIFEMSLSSYKPHTKLVDPWRASRDRAKTYASPLHCDTDSMRSISCIHSTGGKRYLFHYDSEHTCFHHLPINHELESFTFPCLGANCNACSVFLIEVNEPFLESANHVTCLNRLWNLDGQEFHWVWGTVDFNSFRIMKIFDISLKMTETWAVKLNLVTFVDYIPLTDGCCLGRIIIRNDFSDKLVFRDFTASTK